MAYKYRISQRPQYAYGALNAANSSPDGGQREYNPLQTTMQLQRLMVTVEGDLTIATAVGGTIYNRGSILAAFDRMGLDENGVDRFRIDSRMLRQLAEYGVQSKLTTTRLASNAIGVTHLKETFPIFFAHPYSVNPRETAFMVRDPKQSLRFFHELKANANGAGNIIGTAGGGNVNTLSNVKVSVLQVMDEYETARPFFIPQIRMIEVPIVQAQSALELQIITSQYLRGMLIQQDTTVGETNDIINTLALYGDARQIVGPEMINFDQLARAQETAYGGDVYGLANGYYYKNFQPNGRLSDIYNPMQDNNLRFRFDCQPSVKAGATTSTIRVAILELVRDPSAKTPDGRALVDSLEIPI